MQEKTYCLINYGCQMNESDTEHYAGQLEELGYKPVSDYHGADVILVNTCCVRESAEKKIAGKIGELKAEKKRNPDCVICVAGCMAQKDGEKLQKKHPQVDLLLGTAYVNDFKQLLLDYLADRKGIAYTDLTIHQSEFEGHRVRQSPFAAWIPIMYGCNNFCTYCIVPYLRGREISRSVEDILHELDILTERKVREICLLGQNVNSYNDNGVKFPELLKIISAHLDEIKSPIEWIRFESSHPKDFSDELIEVIRTDRKICRGIHLAVQHGSSEVLRRMNRKYTREDYLGLIAKLRKAVPDVELTTDIMLGFPGETEEEFEEAYSLMKEVEYESAFMYFYNPREGTPAEKMDNQIPVEVKKERLQKIINLQLELTQKVMKRRVGKTIKVLADIVSKDDQNELLGKTEQNERVAFRADPKIIGSFVTVRLDSLNGNTFKGTLV